MAATLNVDIEKRFSSGAAVAAAFETELTGGSVLVLFGPSGAGKTTVLRCLAGLERPDSGVIRFRDRVWFDAMSGRSLAPQRRRIGYVFQEQALFPHLTVRQNVGFGLTIRRRADRERLIEDLLSRLGISAIAQQLPRELSGGQVQRVALARALAIQPELLLLDEPFASLDGPARRRLRLDLRTLLAQTGTFAVLVTHDRGEALALGDQIAVLAGGRIRQVGPVLDVMSHPADLQVAESVGIETVLSASVESSERGLLNLRIGSMSLRAIDADAVALGDRVFACIRAEDVILERQASAASSARNDIAARVAAIHREGPLERVVLDCGFPLVSLVSRYAREEMGLAEGSSVVAVIKAISVHLVPRAEPHGWEESVR